MRPIQQRHFILCVLLLPVVLFAGRQAEAAEIALLAGYQFDPEVEISLASQWPPTTMPAGNPGDAVTLDDGSSWAVALNTEFNQNAAQRIGLFYSRHNTRFDSAAGLSTPDIDISVLHFIGTSFYPQGERLSFFVLAGLGATFYKPEDATLRDVTRFSAQIGGGANILLAGNLFLQFDARWLPTFFNGETDVFCSGGCTISVNSDTFSQFQLNAGVLIRF